jgi:hypothetical protein
MQLFRPTAKNDVLEMPATHTAEQPCIHSPEPDLLDDFANTQGLAYPGSIQPQVRPGVYLEVGIPR